MPAKRRIVVLDDSSISLRFTRAYLEGLDFEVRCAGSVAEFAKVIDEFPPDVIVTDVEMPEASGDELCRMLRRNIATGKTPILLFSSLDPKVLAERAAGSGADAYVCKTDGPAALQAALEKLVQAK